MLNNAGDMPHTCRNTFAVFMSLDILFHSHIACIFSYSYLHVYLKFVHIVPQFAFW